MRIVVTGATGQVGSALNQRLQSHGTIVAVNRTALDLSKPETIADVLDQIAPDLLINAAAYTAVDRAEDEPALADLVNAKAPGVMARWAANRNVPFIHFSTDYVFDGFGEEPWCEDDVPHPLSVYGASKLAGEEQIRAANGSCLIIRTSWVYASEGTNFLRRIAELARTETELRVVADQIGAPTSAALIAEAVATMLSGGPDSLRAQAAKAGGIVHLAASGEASWHLFATEIVGGLRSRGVRLAVERIVPIRTEERPTPAQRPLNSRLNLERLQAVFGITTPHWRVALMPELDQLA
jgi:dTDP-4-dehydrorhamnose reductase